MTANRKAHPVLVPSVAKLPGQPRAARSGRRGQGGYHLTRVVRWWWRWRAHTLPVTLVGLVVGVPAGRIIAARWVGSSSVTVDMVVWRAVLAGVGLVVWLGVLAVLPGLRVRMRNRRLCLQFRHRFADVTRDLGLHAPDGHLFRTGKRPYVAQPRRSPTPPVVLSPYGQLTCTVKVPQRHPTIIDGANGALPPAVERGLFLGGGLGNPEWSRVFPAERNASAWRVVRVAYRNAPDQVNWPLHPAPDDMHLVLGCSAEGPNIVDLDAVAHLRPFGTTRSGKGVLGIGLAAQACAAGWLVLIVDGSHAPEWQPWADNGLPNVRVVRCSLTDRFAGANTIGNIAKEVLELGLARDQIIAAAGCHSWAQLPAPLRLVYPRMLVVTDELSALLKGTGDVGKAAGAELESTIRTVAKYGITFCMLDQIINVSNFAISGPTLEQMRGCVWMGDQPGSGTRDRILGYKDWPPTPKGKGGGIWSTYGMPHTAQPIRTPYHSPADLDRFLADQRAGWVKRG